MYFVIEIQKQKDGAPANIVTSHESLAEAESKYYSILAAAAVSDLPVHGAIIVSEEAFPVRNQCYKHA